MKSNSDLFLELDDALFKNQRIEALISCIRILIDEGCVDIAGLPDNALSYSLYEIETLIFENNKKLKEIIEAHSSIKQKESEV